MFNQFKKKKIFTAMPGILPVATDIHSHILPGIDDGSPNLETSLMLIKGLQQLGIKNFVATPHIIGDLYRNTPATINAALEKVKQGCIEAGMQVEISAAAEYMLDDYFMDLLSKKEPLLTLHKNFILTELSFTTPPNDLEEIIFTILTNGYQPVLAHPERYFYYQHDYEKYYRLIELGFYLQVNLLSLTGYYGKGASKAAMYILKKDLAHLVGTDLHHERHLAALMNKDNLALIYSCLGNKKYNDLDTLDV